MLRITVVDSSNAGVRLRVEGRLTGQGVEELRHSCALHASQGGARLILDLADVSFVDGEGIDLLQELIGRHIVLQNLGPFLALRLQDPKSGRLPTQKRRQESGGSE